MDSLENQSLFIAAPISTLRKMIGDRRAPGQQNVLDFYLVFMVKQFVWLKIKNKQPVRDDLKIGFK